MQRTQTCVLCGESSLASQVDGQTDLALELLEAHRFPGDGPHRYIVKPHGLSFVTPQIIARLDAFEFGLSFFTERGSALTGVRGQADQRNCGFRPLHGGIEVHICGSHRE